MLNPDGYVSLHDVCEGSDLPATFIAKIFGDLVRARLLASTKGRGGGFALTRPPSEISLHDIVSVIDGVEQYRRCVVGLTKCDDKQPCAQHEKFKPIRTQILRYLSNTTLDKMSEALVSKIDLMNPPASPTSRV
jgi:Rrf2 family protein